MGFQAGSAKLADSQGEQEQNEEGDEMASAAQGPHRSHREHGEAAGETLQKHLDTKVELHGCFHHVYVSRPTNLVE